MCSCEPASGIIGFRPFSTFSPPALASSKLSSELGRVNPSIRSSPRQLATRQLNKRLFYVFFFFFFLGKEKSRTRFTDLEIDKLRSLLERREMREGERREEKRREKNVHRGRKDRKEAEPAAGHHRRSSGGSVLVGRAEKETERFSSKRISPLFSLLRRCSLCALRPDATIPHVFLPPFPHPSLPPFPRPGGQKIGNGRPVSSRLLRKK